MKKSKPDIHIAQEEDGKHWTVRFEAFMTMEMKFELGVEFEETPPMGGATHKAVATLEDDGAKLKIASQTEKGEVVRIFSLGDDGKELEVVSAQRKVTKHMHVSRPSIFVLLQDFKCDARGAHAKRFFMKE